VHQWYSNCAMWSVYLSLTPTAALCSATLPLIVMLPGANNNNNLKIISIGRRRLQSSAVDCQHHTHSITIIHSDSCHYSWSSHHTLSEGASGELVLLWLLLWVIFHIYASVLPSGDWVLTILLCVIPLFVDIIGHLECCLFLVI
jgi:hypothetical protein